MISDQSMKDFITLSRYIGDRVDYVQGAGGNTSVKLRNAQMAIKASGYLLKELSMQSGYVMVDRDSIVSELERNDLTEECVTNILAKASDKTWNNLRPSIETGFHALLSNNYVIHTHSIYANLLTCSMEGKEIASMLFPEAAWLDYANPGQPLISQFKAALSSQYAAPIVFLENHGIFTTGQSAVEAIDRHEVVTKKICNYFKLKNKFIINECSLDMDFIKNHVLFPDQVVYTMDNVYLNTQAAKETLAAYEFIYRHIKQCELTPRFISKHDVCVINKMESEKYRQALVK